MAKSSRGKAARHVATGTNPGLLTAAERKLLAASEAGRLARMQPAEAQQVLARTRILRDKWRDLLAKQARVQKRAVGGPNARSREKADLFDAAVKRIEAHVARGPAAPAAAKGAPAKKVTKKTRAAAHRNTRAGVRAELATHTLRLNAAAKPAVSRAAVAAPPSKPKPAAAPAAADTAAAPPVGAKGAKAAGRKAGRGKPALVVQPVRFDRTNQRSARAAAKKARLTVSGRTTRLGGHLLASGKRSQARRDGKGR